MGSHVYIRGVSGEVQRFRSRMTVVILSPQPDPRRIDGALSGAVDGDVLVDHDDGCDTTDSASVSNVKPSPKIHMRWMKCSTHLISACTTRAFTTRCAGGSAELLFRAAVEKSWIRPKRHYDELVGTIRQCNS